MSITTKKGEGDRNNQFEYIHLDYWDEIIGTTETIKQDSNTLFLVISNTQFHQLIIPLSKLKITGTLNEKETISILRTPDSYIVQQFNQET
jgi:hypothetical protein